MGACWRELVSVSGASKIRTVNHAHRGGHGMRSGGARARCLVKAVARTLNANASAASGEPSLDLCFRGTPTAQCWPWGNTPCSRAVTAQPILANRHGTARHGTASWHGTARARHGASPRRKTRRGPMLADCEAGPMAVRRTRPRTRGETTGGETTTTPTGGMATRTHAECAPTTPATAPDSPPAEPPNLGRSRRERRVAAGRATRRSSGGAVAAAAAGFVVAGWCMEGAHAKNPTEDGVIFSTGPDKEGVGWTTEKVRGGGGGGGEKPGPTPTQPDPTLEFSRSPSLCAHCTPRPILCVDLVQHGVR